MLGTILWVVLVGAMAERTENARFRFLVDPFLLVVVACLFTQGWQTLKDRSGVFASGPGEAILPLAQEAKGTDSHVD
jgi:hypothetical protein